jgi:hypothetical protein
MTEKLRLDPNELTPGDLKRARVALDGRNPWELLEDPLDAMILAIWCFKSREDPTFTFEDAENVKLGEFDMSGQGPPPIPGGGANGASPGNDAEPASPPTPTVSGAAPS